jgi:hypothetical protein
MADKRKREKAELSGIGVFFRPLASKSRMAGKSPAGMTAVKFGCRQKRWLACSLLLG